jgi:hypothetical protein
MADLGEIEAMIAAALPGASVEVVDETGSTTGSALKFASKFVRVSRHRRPRKISG